ncbi:succinate--CoA ligase subunit alpha [Patescibacteria group bacterium]
MSILINQNTKFIVQGITGSQGAFHAELMLDYGTQIVAGVTPKKGGEEVHGVPVFDSVIETKKFEPSWSILFVPAPFVKAAALESLEEGLNLVIITEHVPVHDALEIIRVANEKKLRVIGPNCPGLITPGEAKAGIMPGQIFKSGDIGVVSKSGTLTYEIVDHLTKNNLGQSTCVGIGGDPIIGSSFIEILELFEKDPETKKIVLIGEIGGNLEEAAAEYIKKNITKPVVGYIAGRTAPPGKTMGHAGAVVSGNAGTAESKQQALEEAGVKVAELPSEVVSLINEF